MCAKIYLTINLVITMRPMTIMTKFVVTAVMTKLVFTAVTTKLVVKTVTTKLVVSAYF